MTPFFPSFYFFSFISFLLVPIFNSSNQLHRWNYKAHAAEKFGAKMPILFHDAVELGGEVIEPEQLLPELICCPTTT